MSVGKNGEYAGGIWVPLRMFWLMGKMGKGTSNPARGGSQNPKRSKGALPPLRSPFLESGTTRILSEWSQIQRACRLNGGSVWVYLPRKAVRIVRKKKPGDWLRCLVNCGCKTVNRRFALSNLRERKWTKQ